MPHKYSPPSQTSGSSRQNKRNFAVFSLFCPAALAVNSLVIRSSMYVRVVHVHHPLGDLIYEIGKEASHAYRKWDSDAFSSPSRLSRHLTLRLFFTSPPLKPLAYTLPSIPVVSAATSTRPYFPLNSRNTKTSPTKRPCRRGYANNRN